MDGEHVVDLLLSLEDNDGVQVTDDDGTVWEGWLDHSEFTELTPDLSRDEGYISYTLLMADDYHIKTPGIGYGASILVKEEDDEWGSPEVVYNDPDGEGLEEFVVRDLEDLEVLE